MNARRDLALLKDAYTEWQKDKAPRLGAALAYYSIFSLAPLLIVAIAIAGFVFRQGAAQQHVLEQMRGLVGQSGAEAIRAMLVSAQKPSSGIIATTIGLITLLFGATGVFAELQDDLNTIWGAKPPPHPTLLHAIRARFMTFAMVLGTGFLLLVSLLLSAIITAMSRFLVGIFSQSAYSFVAQFADFFLFFFLATLLFALIYRILPDVEIAWSDVWTGAAVTAFLFSIGKFIIGKYLGSSGVSSAYGAAGSLIVVLLWVYYSAQILFFGAEFTKVYARQYGTHANTAEGTTSEPASREVSSTATPALQRISTEPISPEAIAPAPQRRPKDAQPEHIPQWARTARTVSVVSVVSLLSYLAVRAERSASSRN